MYNAAWAHINTRTSIWVNVKNGLSMCTLCNNPSSLYSYDDLDELLPILYAFI